MSIQAINVRNQFKGKVREIIRGDVVSEVDVETPWGIVTSVITTRSVDDLALVVGSDVVALVKSTEVSIAKLLSTPAAWRRCNGKALRCRALLLSNKGGGCDAAERSALTRVAHDGHGMAARAGGHEAMPHGMGVAQPRIEHEKRAVVPRVDRIPAEDGIGALDDLDTAFQIDAARQPDANRG